MLLVATLLASYVLTSPSVRIGPIRLSNQVDASTLVCVGTVDEVVNVPMTEGNKSIQRPFARIQVERVLKGDSQARLIFHEAWSRLTDDVTRPQVGQRSLFFLGPGSFARASDEDKQRVTRTLGTERILRNVSSGYGINRIQVDGERETVAYVRGWPLSLRREGRAQGCDLVEVCAWIDTSARFSPELVAVHATCHWPTSSGPDAQDTFDLRILPDGSRRLARKLGENETVVVDRLEEGRWSQLQSVLRSEVPVEGRIVDKTRDSPKRTLLVRIEDRQLEFRQGGRQELEDIDVAQWPTLKRALIVWAAVWDVLDCATCIDDRAGDLHIIRSR